MKRERYILRWAIKGEQPGWHLVYPTGRVEALSVWGYKTKNAAIRRSAITARLPWRMAKIPSQLVVKTKRGTISFERTYGKDPRRTKG